MFSLNFRQPAGRRLHALALTLVLASACLLNADLFPRPATAAPLSSVSGGTVVTWGAITAAPTGLSNVTAIAAGYYHGLALKEDGTVVAWGQNNRGQATVPTGLNNATAIAAGAYHSLALKRDGTVIAWGQNENGEASVPVGLNNVTAIAAGDSSIHSLALKGDGTIVAWGNNSHGQTSIPVGLGNVTAVAAGGFHSLALKGDGTVVAWGNNDFGQTSIPVGLGNVIAIAAGYYHSLALKEDGTVVAWGWNGFGQTSVPDGLSNVTAIAAGAHHNLALKGDGTVMAWGRNNSGQTNVPAGLSNVTAIAAGQGPSLALVGAAAPTPTAMPTATPTATAVPTPRLHIPSTPQQITHGNFNVPVVFTGNGSAIASVGFGLTYDTTCLSFDGADSNGDGIPNGLTGLPSGFVPSISYTASQKLEVVLYDDTPPFSTLSDGPLFTVAFTVKAACITTDGSTRTVTVDFAATPAPSFGDPTGVDVPGTATGATIPLRFNAAPTGLALSPNTVAENSPTNTAIGAFSTTDADSGDTHTYSLVAGDGDTDNASFTITVNTLKTAALFDYETKSSYTVHVRTTDSGGLVFEQTFTISVTDLYEAPIGVIPSDGPLSDGNAATVDIQENATAGSVVALLLPTNLDTTNHYTYTLVAGSGDTDNGRFLIEGNQLKSKAVFDYETKNSYSLRLRISDRLGNTAEQALVIHITNVIEAMTAVDDLMDPRVTVFRGGQPVTIDVLANDHTETGTISVTNVSQPAAGQGSVTNNTTHVSYTAPNASGYTTFTYQATNGITTSNSATVSLNYVADHASGDCNGNGNVAAADFIAIVLEIFDANNTKYQNQPAWWLSYTGDFPGSPLGCDANNSGNGTDHSSASVTAADIICTVLIFFNHGCGGGSPQAAVHAAHLSVDAIPAASGAPATVTVTLHTGGASVAAAAFALVWDATPFDATDADGDGVPDAVTLTLPAGVSKAVQWQAATRRLEVALYGASLPLPTLSDGVLATVTVAGVATPTLTQVSLSDPTGNDLLTPRTGLFLPLITR